MYRDPGLIMGRPRCSAPTGMARRTAKRWQASSNGSAPAASCASRKARSASWSTHAMIREDEDTSAAPVTIVERRELKDQQSRARPATQTNKPSRHQTSTTPGPWVELRGHGAGRIAVAATSSSPDAPERFDPLGRQGGGVAVFAWLVCDNVTATAVAAA